MIFTRLEETDAGSSAKNWLDFCSVQIPLSEYQRHAVNLQPITKPGVTAETSAVSEAFKSAVFQRLFAITVPARSKDAVLGLVSRLQTVLEGIIMQGASGAFTSCVSDFCSSKVSLERKYR